MKIVKNFRVDTPLAEIQKQGLLNTKGRVLTPVSLCAFQSMLILGRLRTLSL